MEEAIQENTKITSFQEEHEEKNESNTLGKLYDALAKAQLEMLPAKTSSDNPFFKSKYADLSEVVRSSRKPLANQSLSVIQRILPKKDGGMMLYTRLGHASGEWIESKMPIKLDKPGIQSFGSSLTYLRRYMYAAMVGVVASGEDDDGELAMQGVKRG